MRCPNCYGKIDKLSGICTKCGFNKKSLENASNQKAKELIRSGDGDLTIETTVLPNDLSKKSLLLYCGFLGLFGGHYFYVGKFWRGLFNLICGVFGLVFMTFSILKLTGNKVFLYFDYFASIFFVIILILTIFDFINIALNRFKVLVYVEQKKKK